ncbi:DNA-binding response regulator [Spirochaetia bacterium]|nr:DNA-binding response regulator [Spirochaetia bacterium]
MIRIVVVAENRTELDTIQRYLSCQGDFELVGCGADGYDAIHLVAAKKPDIALLDEQLPMLDGAETTLSLKRWSPKTRVIILTFNPENLRVLRAISNGAAGYISKNSGLDVFRTGIRIAHQGCALMTREIAAKAFSLFPVIQDEPPRVRKPIPPSRKSAILPINISRQELRLITCIGQGLSNKEIAASLQLSSGTIRNNISVILQKTGLRNRTQVAIYAYTIGLVAD